jgi:hypothetical protein
MIPNFKSWLATVICTGWQKYKYNSKCENVFVSTISQD